MKLGSLIDVISGFAFDSNKFNNSNDGVPLVRIRDVGNTCSDTYYSGDFNSNFLLNNGDYIIGMDGNFRLAEWNGGPALLNQRVCKITPKSEKLWKRYLYYFLPKELQKIEDSTSFATVKHLSVKKIENIEIHLPPLETQKKIAAILDKADELRQNDKKILEKYDQLAQSVFLEMFGDIEIDVKDFKYCYLSELVEKKGGIICGPFGSQLKIGEYIEDGIPVYGIDNVQKNKFIEAKPKFISEEKYKFLTSFSVKEDDILITRTGTVGRTCIAPKGINKAVIGPNLLRIRLSGDNLNPTYFSFALNYSNYLIRQIEMASPGATVAVYNTGNLKKLRLPLPPLELQKKFASIFNKIQEQKYITEKSLQKSEDLFQSLLQRAFKSE